MILALDIGNSHLFGGVFDGNNVILRFRHQTSGHLTSDQLGIFLKTVLRENNCDPQRISQIAISSVVPHLDYSLRAGCRKYFLIDPFFLKAGVKTGLKIKIKNPLEVGSDLIAGAMAALDNLLQDTVIIDFGTATTFSILSKDKTYQGTVILPGIRLAMESLDANTAKLSTVEIKKPASIIGRSTKESIQSGIYYSHLGALKEILSQITRDFFNGQKPHVIATGGFAYLFNEEGLFNRIEPDLILKGLKIALELNHA